MGARTILHADLDAFFASVEQLDNPALRGKPVIVGAPVEARGVVAAASYEARRFGIRSAMPMGRALRLCPEAVLVLPRFHRYAELSRAVMDIFRSVTPLIEPLSMDEAFLDVTAVLDSASGAGRLARDLKRRVHEETGLIVSVGAGANKTVAKIASDHGKPDGLVVVPQGQEAEFLEPLPTRALWGIGPKTQEVLDRLGIRTIGELARADERQIERLLGSRGPYLQLMARGSDNRSVHTEYERKSIGAERTFPRDLPLGPELRETLAEIAARVARRMEVEGVGARTVAIKLRYADFRTITRQTCGARPIEGEAELAEAAMGLLERTARPGDRFRLLGVQASGLTRPDDRQLRLWPAVRPA